MYSVGISIVSFYGFNVCQEINDLIGTSAVFLSLLTIGHRGPFKYLKISPLGCDTITFNRKLPSPSSGQNGTEHGKKWSATQRTEDTGV
jgi:hypothetical protein